MRYGASVRTPERALRIAPQNGKLEIQLEHGRVTALQIVLAGGSWSGHTLPGLGYATGHFRNGVLLAPLTGRVVADLVLENREDEVLRTTSPQRFGEY